MKTKRLGTLAALVALAGMFGCQTSSPRGGGMASEDSFRIMIPEQQLQLRQGAVQTIDVTLSRGDLFKQDVKMDVRSAPQGLSVDPNNFVIKASDRPLSQVRITAAKDAALGEYRVTLTGTPQNGQPAMAEIRVNVQPN